ncbi:hypothetical protein [Algibacter lectus]|uniref:hypothetical protein n=1 Tax=Algibacter lectus TaxID=221126 RepID=UPI002494A079|nr:hypothetical protein [Algibacter lectus]MDO7136881.1 hypothetical protein [Algibacter lectus]
MKKKYLVLFVLAVLSVTAYAQKASVEKSTYGVQTGFLGVWVHREVKLSNEIALRAEVGMDLGLWGGDFYPKSGYLLAPVIRLEPRWYYNLDKRVSKSRSISGNAGNFLSLQTSYHPNWFTISNYDNVEVVNQVSIIPTWGIKRNIGKHFNYETGIGIGYAYYFAKSAGYLENEGYAAVNLNLRIGYRF